MAGGQNLVPLVNIKIAGKWMFIPLKMVLYNRYYIIGIDPYPYLNLLNLLNLCGLQFVSGRQRHNLSKGHVALNAKVGPGHVKHVKHRMVSYESYVNIRLIYVNTLW